MASESTITIQNTLDFISRFVHNRPLAIGNSLQPALTSATLVRGSMLGPPFRWRWNRTVTPIDCIIGQQDYLLAGDNFGYIESAAIKDPTTELWHPVEVKIGLELDSTPGRPQYLCAQLDMIAVTGYTGYNSAEGKITFRTQPVPDQTYIISMTSQSQVTPLTSLNATWGIPDELMHIYTWGMMALMGLFTDNTTMYQLGNAKFVSTLLGAQQGLDQSQVNVFLNNWSSVTGSQITNQAQLSQGQQMRGV